VCRRGHVQENSLAVAPATDGLGFCPDCGASITARCGACGIRIRGEYYTPGVALIGFEFKPAKFCDGCGEPYPWATRQDRIYQLENLLDEEEIDDYTKLLVREDLERLRESPDLDQDAQLAVWQRVRGRAPGLLAGGAWNIAQGLLNAYVQQKLGL